MKIGYIHLNNDPIIVAIIDRKMAGDLIDLYSNMKINELICLGDITPTKVARIE